MAIVRSFHKHRGEASFTLQKLLSILREQIPLVAPAQTKYHVTEIPTERTLRFYTANGLVDKPLDRQGSRSLYGYRHLLQVLAIKYLQSQYLPLVKIRSLLENSDNRDLELLIPEIAPVTATHRGIAREDRQIFVRSLLAAADQLQPLPLDQKATAGEPETRTAVPLGAWHRLEVGPGIELHIHEAALSEENRERLRGALLRELGVLRGWFVDAQKQ